MTYARDPYDTDQPPCFCDPQGGPEFCPAHGDPDKPAPEPPGDPLKQGDALMWVVVLGSHQPYHASACWVFSDQAVAERFAAFVTREIDPAQVLKALDPVDELLNWRENIAPGISREPM